MLPFISDDHRNDTRAFRAFIRGELTDPRAVVDAFDDVMFRYQVVGEICSLLDDGALETSPRIQLLNDILSEQRVVELYRAVQRRFETEEAAWRQPFERAFVRHVAALPPPAPLREPKDVFVAAKNGDIAAVLRLLDEAEAQHLMLTLEDEQDLIAIAADAGHPELEAILEQFSIWGEETPLEVVREAARDGVPQAQLDLAVRIVEMDERSALKWVERAAAQSLPRACVILGQWLEAGVGIEPNAAAARRCFERGAELGDPEGMFRLGEMHRETIPQDYAGAFFWLSEAVQRGHSGAKVALGSMYEYGEGREIDPKRAFALYSEAADADDEVAQMEVARCHADGVGTERNPELAFRRYQQAANLGFADAYRALGWAYANGLGVEKSIARAVDAYERAVTLGSGGAAVALGSLHLNNGSPADALKWFRKGEQLGYEDDVSHWIASALEAMKEAAAVPSPVMPSRERSEPEELEPVRRAAASGDVKSMVTLGRCLIRGAGIAEDREAGMQWLRRAAATEDDEAICALAHELADDEPETAARLYERAAMRGHAEAQFFWGQCLEHGEGTGQDEKAAVTWYRRAAAGRLAGAQHRLGLLLLHGDLDVGQDRRAGVKLLKLAAEQLHDDAMEDLAAWYLYGPDATPQRDREAVDLLRKTLGHGGADAYTNLGFCYLQGRGVTRDLVEAERLLRDAVKQGSAAAYGRLAELYFERGEREKALEFLDRGIAAGDLDSLLMRAEDALDGVQRDTTLGVRLLRRAIEIDPEDPDARLLLGRCLLFGEGTPKAVDEARALLAGVAEEGDTRAYGFLAMFHEERGEEREKLEWLDRGVKENEPACMVQLADHWLRTTKSKDEWAVQLLRKAVALDSPDARFLLGYCLAFGRGGDDVTEAESLFDHESLRSDPDAVTYLMFLYLNRLRDVPRAIETARRGVALQSSDCMTVLGVAHELGIGATKEPAEALRWYQAALKQNDLGAMLHMARLSLDPASSLKNAGRAFSLLETASKHPDAVDPFVMIPAIPNVFGHIWHQLGRCWENGWGTAASVSEALICYRRAAEAGSTEARLALQRLEGAR
jgi:TPR repeat protein